MNVKEPSIFANRFMCEIAWRLTSLLALFGKKATLTKESVQSSQANVSYDSSKIRKELNIDFFPLEDTIEYTLKNRL